jgi:hypothetical protein
MQIKKKISLLLAVYHQSVLPRSETLETHSQNFFFQLNTYHSPYVTSSLMRGWICSLQLLLAFVRAFILRSESRRPHGRILQSQIRDFPNVEPRSPYLYHPRTGWPSYTPGTGFHSQGYGGGNSNPPPHPGGHVCYALMHKFEVEPNTKHSIADFRSCYMCTPLK